VWIYDGAQYRRANSWLLDTRSPSRPQDMHEYVKHTGVIAVHKGTALCQLHSFRIPGYVENASLYIGAEGAAGSGCLSGGTNLGDNKCIN
jgi:hypothetical protein